METKLMKFFAAVAAAAAAMAAGASGRPVATFAGKQVETLPVTLSAGPINKVFDGRQRERYQTKEGFVVSFDVTAPGELSLVYPGGAPDDLVVYPLSRGTGAKAADGSYVLKIDRPGQFVVSSLAGQVADLHVFANPPFAEPAAHGKVTRFARGEHRPGLIAPESGETVILEEGAVVHAEVFVLNATNVTICGRGVFDFSEWDRADPRAVAFREAHGLPREDTEFACNPFVVYASGNVKVEGVTLKNAPFWTVVVRNGSTDIDIGNLKIVGNWRFNSDGINIQASSRVRVHDSFVRSFDDCLVARAAYMDGDDGLPTRDLVFEDNVLWCDWGKNCEVWAGHKPTVMENIVFRRNALAHVHFTGCDVTTWYGSPSTVIRDIVFEDTEYDATEPRWREIFQKEDGVPMDFERETDLYLLYVTAWEPAENLGNQQFGKPKDLSLYKADYDGIRFSRPRLFGSGWNRVLIKSATATDYQHIRNVTLEGLPEGTVFDVSGNTDVGKNVK